MTTLKARVRNRRLVLDEPTDLPEGTEIELVVADAADADWNLTDEAISRLQKSLAQAVRGETVPAELVLGDLRALTTATHMPASNEERAELDRRLDEHRGAPGGSEWSTAKARILER